MLLKPLPLAGRKLGWFPPVLSRSAHLGFQQIQELPPAVFGLFGFFSHSLPTIPAEFHIGAPQFLAISTPALLLAGNLCRAMAGTWVYSQCSVPLFAIINYSRLLLAFVLGYGRVSLAFTAALSKYCPSRLRSKSTSIPVLEHPCTNLALKITPKADTFLILCSNAHSEMHVQVSRDGKSAITGDTARSCTPGHYIMFTLFTPGWLVLTCMSQ